MAALSASPGTSPISSNGPLVYLQPLVLSLWQPWVHPGLPLLNGKNVPSNSRPRLSTSSPIKTCFHLVDGLANRHSFDYFHYPFKPICFYICNSVLKHFLPHLPVACLLLTPAKCFSVSKNLSVAHDTTDYCLKSFSSLDFSNITHMVPLKCWAKLLLTRELVL